MKIPENLYYHPIFASFPVALFPVSFASFLLYLATGKQDFEAGAYIAAAFGAAWLKPLAWAGVALWALPLARLGKAWLALYAGEIRSLHGAAPSLAAALAGFAATLLLGLLHGGGMSGATGAAHAFILAFLFPLVTGAVSQLLPVWARSGPQTAWHAQVRQKLRMGGGLRGALFLAGGILLGFGWRPGLLLALAGLIAFMLQLAVAVAGGKK